MAQLTGKQRSEHVQRMFARLAEHYDRANRWMTWGQDKRWRKKVLHLASLPMGGSLLDVGTGTGDLALESLARDPSARVVGMDFTSEMINKARERTGGEGVTWINADALCIPFMSSTFDAIVSGYLLRNVIDIDRVLKEQYRVLKPGGHIVCLDSTPLPKDLWHLPARFYVNCMIPIIGWLAAGNWKDYTYLPQSTRFFTSAEELHHRFVQAGFKNAQFKRLMGGAMAIHWGEK